MSDILANNNSSNIVVINNHDEEDDAQMLHPLEEQRATEVAATADNAEHQENQNADGDSGHPEVPPLPSSPPQDVVVNEETEILTETFKDVTREVKPQSNLGDDVYIQMKNRFRRLLKSQLQGNETKSDDNDPEVASLLRQYFGSVMAAVIIQMLLHNVTLVLQGLLAGLACGHCVFAFVFAEPDVLVRGYQWMAVPVQAAFYFCFAISTVNAFDRFEAGGNFKETIKKFLSLQRGGFNVIIWAAGTIGSVLMATYDEYMAKPDIVIIEKSDTLIIWRYLSLWRAICALLGWLFVALQPNTNYTRDRLLRLAGTCNETERDPWLYNRPHNFVDFAADENGLWLIYTKFDNPHIFVSKIAPDFYVVNTWEIEVNGTELADAFIMCGVIYGLESATDRDTYISFAYDLYRNESIAVDIPWYNPYRGLTMLHYNPVDSRLYFFDNGKLLSVNVRIEEEVFEQETQQDDYYT